MTEQRHVHLHANGWYLNAADCESVDVMYLCALVLFVVNLVNVRIKAVSALCSFGILDSEEICNWTPRFHGNNSCTKLLRRQNGALVTPIWMFPCFATVNVTRRLPGTEASTNHNERGITYSEQKRNQPNAMQCNLNETVCIWCGCCGCCCFLLWLWLWCCICCCCDSVRARSRSRTWCQGRPTLNVCLKAKII